MANTNKDFANKVDQAYEDLYTSLFTAFEIYINTHHKKNLEIEDSISKKDTIRNLRESKKRLEAEGLDKNKENFDLLSRVIIRKEKESIISAKDNTATIRNKQKIIGKQIVVYCISVFEKFRVALIELLFKYDDDAKKEYLRTFREIASDHQQKTKDQRYAKVYDPEEAIKPKNFKLIQDYNKMSAIEKRMHSVDLENEHVKKVYNQNLLVSTMFREVRNLVVHRSEKKVFVDGVFLSSIKNISGGLSSQGKFFKKVFKNYVGLDYDEVLDINNNNRLNELRDQELRMQKLMHKNNSKASVKKWKESYNRLLEAERKLELYIGPYFVFDSIMAVLNLAHLYCFSVSKKNGFILSDDLFNYMCIDYHENNNKNIYIGFFVTEMISELYVQDINKNLAKNNKDKILDKYALKLVNYVLANDLVCRHMVDKGFVEVFLKRNKLILSKLKKLPKSKGFVGGKVLYEIVDSFIKKDLSRLTKSTDRFLQSEGYEKSVVFSWYIFRSLSNEPYIDKYLNSPVKQD